MIPSVLDDPDHKLLVTAQAVVTANRAQGRTVALAESCTGGLVSAVITDIPGSSEVLLAGFVTYADASKQTLLGVNPDIIETFGSVSAACAWAMARGALERSGADVAVAVSGVAGPGGGSASKPIGTVVFARAARGQSPDEVYAERRNFDPTANRAEIRRQAALFALELLMPDTVMPGVSTTPAP